MSDQIVSLDLDAMQPKKYHVKIKTPMYPDGRVYIVEEPSVMTMMEMGKLGDELKKAIDEKQELRIVEIMYDQVRTILEQENEIDAKELRSLKSGQLIQILDWYNQNVTSAQGFESAPGPTTDVVKEQESKKTTKSQAT